MVPWYVLGLLAAFLISIEVLFEKKILFRQHVSSFLTMLYALLVALVLPFINQVNFDLSLLTYGVIALDALFGVLALVLLYKALRHLEVSNSIPMENLSVLVVVLLGVFVLGEKLSGLNLVGIIGLLIGGFLLCFERKDIWGAFHPKNRKILMLVLLGNISLGISIVFDKVLMSSNELGIPLTKMDPFSALFLGRLFMFLGLLALTFLVYGGFKDIKGIWKSSWAFLVFAAAFNNLGGFFYYWAVSVNYVALVEPIVAMYTFFDVVLGGNIFHEHHVVKRLVACALMLVGAYLVVI